MSRRIIFVAFDQLSLDHGALAQANPDDVALFIESAQMMRSREWHPERTYLLISAARHFANEVRDRGMECIYLQVDTISAGLMEARSATGIEQVVSTHPSSFAMARLLGELGVEFVANDLFLTSRSDFDAWAGAQKSFVMENFYRLQRKRLNVLMDGDQPIGGQWNFDADNRLPPPKNYTYPPYLIHAMDSLDEEVAKELGHTPSGVWGTTRAAALDQLTYFLDNNFAGFGPYEDAVPADNWAVHHSLLSTYLNIGLLHPREVIDAAVAKYEQGGVPIASAEAFVRQIIGWREYVHGMYWFLGEDYRNGNGLDAQRPLLPAFTDSGCTKMACVSGTVADIEQRAWVHHIPRLMILANLALITGVNPQEFLGWMRRVFIDAYDWVMVPNVIGMGVHADGGVMMTKPYAAGGAYISRMTSYCKGCAFDPKKRTGEDACPFTTLYWDFLDRNRTQFSKNHRMGQQLRGLDRLSDLPEVRARAEQVLAGLSAGGI